MRVVYTGPCMRAHTGLRTRAVDPECLLPCVRWLRDRYTKQGCCDVLCADDGEPQIYSTINSSGMVSPAYSHTVSAMTTHHITYWTLKALFDTLMVKWKLFQGRHFLHTCREAKI